MINDLLNRTNLLSLATREVDSFIGKRVVGNTLEELASVNVVCKETGRVSRLSIPLGSTHVEVVRKLLLDMFVSGARDAVAAVPANLKALEGQEVIGYDLGVYESVIFLKSGLAFIISHTLAWWAPRSESSLPKGRIEHVKYEESRRPSRVRVGALVLSRSIKINGRVLLKNVARLGDHEPISYKWGLPRAANNVR